MTASALQNAICDVRLSIIPAGAVTDPRIEARDLQVLALLGRHTNQQGWCFRSQVKMAEELRCGRATVQRALERLYEAGWVERRLRSRTAFAADPKHPHAAHAYRVKLDRDDVPDDVLFADADAAAETASCGASEGGCQPVGAPPDAVENSVDNPVDDGMGVPTDGHGVPAQDGQGGAHPERAPMGTMTLNSDSNGERDARARARPGLKVEKFLKLWPTAATDSRTAIEREWIALTPDEQQAALDGIEPFKAELQRHKRSTTPAGATYLRERKWEGLAATPAQPEYVAFPAWSKLWWAMIFACADRGEDIRFRVHYATQIGRRETSERADKMPPPEAIEALRHYPSDGDAVAAWRPWFAVKGVKLPEWRDRVWVFLPGPEPPMVGQPALGLLHRGAEERGGT